MSDPSDKPLMRSLGEFFGHIVKGIRTKPGEPPEEKTEVRRTVEEEDRGDMVLRRTTIEEIEYRGQPGPAPKQTPKQAPEPRRGDTSRDTGPESRHDSSGDADQPCP